MKIEDISKIYEFLGNLHLLGFVSLIVILTIALWILIAPGKEESKIGPKSARWAIAVIIIALFALYADSRSKTHTLKVANFIIQDMIGTNFKQKTFSEIKLPDEEEPCGKEHKKILMDVINEFPQQFSYVKLGDSGKESIAVIDPRAVAKIDSQLNAKANRTAQLLANIINTGKVDTVFISQGYSQIFKLTDYEGFLINDSFFKLLVGRNNLLPIYDKKWNIMGFTITKKEIGFPIKK